MVERKGWRWEEVGWLKRQWQRHANTEVHPRSSAILTAVACPPHRDMIPTGSSKSSQKSSGGGSSGTETSKTCHCLRCVGSSYWCVKWKQGGGYSGAWLEKVCSPSWLNVTKKKVTHKKKVSISKKIQPLPPRESGSDSCNKLTCIVPHWRQKKCTLENKGKWRGVWEMHGGSVGLRMHTQNKRFPAIYSASQH